MATGYDIDMDMDNDLNGTRSERLEKLRRQNRSSSPDSPPTTAKRFSKTRSRLRSRSRGKRSRDRYSRERSGQRRSWSQRSRDKRSRSRDRRSHDRSTDRRDRSWRKSRSRSKSRSRRRFSSSRSQSRSSRSSSRSTSRPRSSKSSSRSRSSSNPDLFTEVTFGGLIEYPDGLVPMVAETNTGWVSPVRGQTIKKYMRYGELEKENLNLKFRIYFLEERLQQKFVDEDVIKTRAEEAEKDKAKFQNFLYELREEIEDKTNNLQHLREKCAGLQEELDSKNKDLANKDNEIGDLSTTRLRDEYEKQRENVGRKDRDMQLVEITADLAEENKTATQATEMLETESAERMRLEKELKDIQGRYQSIKRNHEKLEMEMMQMRLWQAESANDGDFEEDDVDGGIYKERYEKMVRELAFTKKGLQQQHEEEIESEHNAKKGVEKRLHETLDELEDVRRQLLAAKKKNQKLLAEMQDSKLHLEEQMSHNNDLERKQRRFDSELNKFQEEARTERTMKEKLQCERDELMSEKFSLEKEVQRLKGDAESSVQKYERLQKELGDTLAHSGMKDDHEPQHHQDELDLPPIGSEEIDQHVAVVDDHLPMTPKLKKLYEKQQKEIKKEEAALEKQKKKEERERKRIEKERKALIAKEKKAAKSKGKQSVSYLCAWATCSTSYREPDIRERRDSKMSNDISQDWDEARHQENGGNVTPEHTCKRLSSFDDIKIMSEYDQTQRKRFQVPEAMDGQLTPECPSTRSDQPDGGSTTKETVIHTLSRDIERRVNLIRSPDTMASSDSGNIDESDQMGFNGNVTWPRDQERLSGEFKGLDNLSASLPLRTSGLGLEKGWLSSDRDMTIGSRRSFSVPGSLYKQGIADECLHYNVHDSQKYLARLTQLRFNSDDRTLFAIGMIDHFEKLHKQVNESHVILKGMAARVKERLMDFATMPATERVMFSTRTLREYYLAAENMKICLEEERSLISCFWTSELPAPNEKGEFVNKKQLNEYKHNLQQSRKRRNSPRNSPMSSPIKLTFKH